MGGVNAGVVEHHILPLINLNPDVFPLVVKAFKATTFCIHHFLAQVLNNLPRKAIEIPTAGQFCFPMQREANLCKGFPMGYC